MTLPNTERQGVLQKSLDHYRQRLALARTMIAFAEAKADVASFGVMAVKRMAYENGVTLDEPKPPQDSA